MSQKRSYKFCTTIKGMKKAPESNFFFKSFSFFPKKTPKNVKTDFFEQEINEKCL